MENKLNFIPDTLVQIDTLNEQQKLFFVEFKIEKDFKLCKLANDYLKFKYYTQNAKANISFVYITLKQQKIDNLKLPFININGNNVDFIDKKLDVDKINKDANIFVFSPMWNDGEPNPSPKINFKTLILSQKITNEIEKQNLNLENDSFALNDYLKYISKFKFGKEVIFANVIKKSFNKINELHISLLNFINNNELGIPLPEETYLTIKEFADDNVLNIENFITEFAEHLDNSIVKKSMDNTINRAEYNVTYKRSLWIILIMEKLSRDLELGISFLQGNILKSKELKDATILIYKLDSNYKNSTPNFNKLALGVVHYIRNLYLSVGYLEDGEYVFKNEYISYNSNTKIKKYFESIFKELKILNKNEKIQIDDYVLGLRLLKTIL
ncbi:hypothetical protein [Williamsoniiplasma lucivorax]|uniref:Uncharacterized protein n=1 Tax=Williamsoniiplasma lucivorax TaxID=209274 RepID=A0A2S5RG30_9MOLU|nr:hypothetical protein [Williamsoniiplasma lucivorax]PPE06085.1 hypothetical protein ELUCI_v1c03760 [Williamsoniiplasma lucivorax]